MVLMIRPRCSMTSGRAARVTLIVPISVTSITRSTSALVVSLNSFTTHVAALFTRIETGPSSARTSCKPAATDAALAMSIWMGCAFPPQLRMDSATLVADSWERSATATPAPACASVVAIASPMPLPPPVTSATRPDRSIGMLISSQVLSECGSV